MIFYIVLIADLILLQFLKQDYYENSVSNIELPHYHFFHHDLPTAAGGGELYVSKNLKSIPRPDLSITCRAGRVLLGRGRSL